MQPDLFTYLAIGLMAYERNQAGYPYPNTLQYALNRLAGAMIQQGKSYPVTITDTLALFHQPLREWWLNETLPSSIDSDFPLLYEGSLDEQAIEFLVNIPVTVRASLPEIEAVLDNQAIEELLQTLREIYHTRPERAQRAYVKVRQFIIQNPYTTNQELIRQLSGLREIDFTLIQQMYEPVYGDPQFLHENQHWSCPHCHGLLRWIHGRPRCAKPSVCARLYPDYGGKQPISPDPDLLVLRWSIHTRTCIPGIREVALFDELNSDRFRDQLIVSLWPGIDRYDLQIRFQDEEVWAVDVKDYKNPHQLGQKIAVDSLYDAEKVLRWQRGYYIVPFYRTNQYATYDDYLQKVVQAADSQLQDNVAILDEAGFMQAVEEKVARLY